MGKHMLRLLHFALDYPNSWHSYGTDRTTVQAIQRLRTLRLLEVNEFRQFRIKQAKGSVTSG